MKELSDKEYKKVFLDRWCHVGKKGKERTNGLFSCTKFLLQFNGFIQHENIIIFINPSSKHNFINVKLAKRLQVITKNIQSTQVEGGNVQFFTYLKIIMDKYFLHLYFYAIDMDDADIFLGIYLDGLNWYG
jgi:hypothetical protein